MAHGSTSFGVGVGEDGLVVARAGEDAEDRHRAVEGGERHDATPSVADRAEARPAGIARTSAVGEGGQAFTVGDDRLGVAGSVFWRAGVGDVVVEFFEMLDGFAPEHDAVAVHLRAACLAASSARTSSVLATSFGAATSAS